MSNDLIDKVTASPINANPITTEKRNIMLIDIPPADSYLLYALKCMEYAEKAQKWAESAESPDGQEDADNPTGETMSAKEWALYAKDIIKQIDPDKMVTAVTETDGTVNIKKGNGTSDSFEVITPSMKNAVNGVAGLDDKSKLLSQVYDFATEEEVQAGTDNKKPVNAAGVKQAISTIFADEVDYIVESYREGTEWYKVYKSGKVEQGGYWENKKAGTSSENVINLYKPYADKKYNVNLTPIGTDSTYPLSAQWFMLQGQETTNFTIRSDSSAYHKGSYWETKGQGA